MLRCEEKGWILCGMNDRSTRRGIWYRHNADGSVELCGGREGDDAYVMLVPGEPVTRAQVDDLVDVLSRAALCVEEQAYSFLQICGEARVREMLSAEPTRVADPAEPDRTAPEQPPADR